MLTPESQDDTAMGGRLHLLTQKRFRPKHNLSFDISLAFYALETRNIIIKPTGLSYLAHQSL